MNTIDSKIDYKIIGQRIRDERKAKNWSQAKLSEILDVSIEYISRVERGASKINLKRLADVSLALNVPIEKLITGTSTESKIYLNKEFEEILSDCTPDKQQLIYNIAKIVKNINFK